MIRPLLALLLLGSVATSVRATELSADEAEIRRQDHLWGEAVAKQDASLVISLYADDAIVLDPDAPARRGLAEMRTIWADLVKVPGLGIAIVPEKITIIGDVALDFGRFELTTTPEGGQPQTQVNKYLTVWRKLGGHWRVIYDAWNTNAPAPR